jgi:hypothetical protein
MTQFDILQITQLPTVLGCKNSSQIAQKLTLEQVWQLWTLQLTHKLLTGENFAAQVWHTLDAEHRTHEEILHKVHFVAPPDGIVNPGLQEVQKLIWLQLVQLFTLHKMQLPPNCEIEYPEMQFEQKFGVLSQAVQLSTLH